MTYLRRSFILKQTKLFNRLPIQYMYLHLYKFKKSCLCIRILETIEDKTRLNEERFAGYYHRFSNILKIVFFFQNRVFSKVGNFQFKPIFENDMYENSDFVIFVIICFGPRTHKNDN